MAEKTLINKINENLNLLNASLLKKRNDQNRHSTPNIILGFILGALIKSVKK